MPNKSTHTQDKTAKQIKQLQIAVIVLTAVCFIGLVWLVLLTVKLPAQNGNQNCSTTGSHMQNCQGMNNYRNWYW